MKYGYISKINSAKEFQEYIALFEQRGVHLDNIVVNLDFDDLATSLKEGDTVVVCSYVGIFPSLGAYLNTAIELMERGVILESLLEPNICITYSNRELVRELNYLNYQLRSASSIKSINKLKEGGKKVGRPRGSCSSDIREKIAQVEKLRKESGVSVVTACKLAACNYRTYYRLRSENNV